MQKDFDHWNENKKRIHAETSGKLYHQREVWWCALGLNVGFEQDGVGAESQRPVLILKGFSKDVCLIIPLTTSTKQNRYHVALGDVGGKDAYAIISQIRLVDTRRLVNKIGYIGKDTFERIRKTAKELL